MTGTPLAPGFPFPASAFLTCPHSSVIPQYRNLHLLSIGYDSRPRLRPRLTQSRSALLWKPWIFGHKDSHLILATHSGILSSMQSTAPYGTASSRMQCSSTNLSVSHRPVFLLNSCLGQFSAACFQAPLLPKLRGYFAEFLNNASSVGLRILSSSTCVGLRYGCGMNNSGFSRHMAHILPY